MPGRAAGLLIVLAAAAGSMLADVRAAAMDATGPAPTAAASAVPPNDAAAAEQKVYADYMRALHQDMQASAKPEQRALAAIDAVQLSALYASVPESPDATPARETDEAAGLSALAASDPNNRKLQWIVATGLHDDARADAVARIQAMESDNGAAWALSLSSGAADATVDHLLERIASSTRFDSHFADPAAIILDAMRNRPVPDSLVASADKQLGPGISADTLAKMIAFSRSAMAMQTFETLFRACRRVDKLTPMRRNACVDVGRLMVDQGSTVNAMNSGVALLEKFDALDDARASRARRMWWCWSIASNQPQNETMAAYLDDILAGRSEMEAAQRVAANLGQPEPPADWRAPRESAL